MVTNPPAPDEIALKIDTEFLADRVVVQGGARWKWVKDLGAGGFGVVSLEQEEETGSFRAVKRLDSSRLNFQKINFRRELQTLLAVKNHELFVDFLCWYQDHHFVYLAMEYIPHGDLDQYLKTYRVEAKSNVREITKQVLEGLVELHNKSICHRDLKPQNILMASLSPIRIKLIDFGTSKCEEGTILRTQWGTAGYQAPELLGLLPREMYTGVKYSNSMDIWALGCVLFKILTLYTPFTRTGILGSETHMGSTTDTPQTDMRFFQEYCSGTVEFPIGDLGPSVCKWGIDFIKRCLDPNPRRRLTSGDALNHNWIFYGEYGDFEEHIPSVIGAPLITLLQTTISPVDDEIEDWYGEFVITSNHSECSWSGLMDDGNQDLSASTTASFSPPMAVTQGSVDTSSSEGQFGVLGTENQEPILDVIRLMPGLPVDPEESEFKNYQCEKDCRYRRQLIVAPIDVRAAAGTSLYALIQTAIRNSVYQPPSMNIS